MDARIMKKFRFVLLILFGLLLSSKMFALGSLYINDKADLLTEEEEEYLEQAMAPICEFGGVAFVSNDEEYNGSASSLAEGYCLEYFGSGQSGTVFLIDMYNRRIEIYSDGEIYKVIGTTWANAITDNVYTYATDEEYFLCAYNAFSQIATILEGGKVSAPMRYASSVMMGIALSLLIMYLILWNSRKKKLGSNIKLIKEIEELEDNAKYSDDYDYSKDLEKLKYVTMVDKTLIREEKIYHSSSSSGGGHGGGGGHSGGGGGHGF